MTNDFIASLQQRLDTATRDAIIGSSQAPMDRAVTPESILSAMGRFSALPAVPPPPRIVFTAYALKDSEERAFPESAHRSARIRKKLIKRFGGEFRRVPTTWRVGDVVYAHPSFRTRIKETLPADNNSLSFRLGTM